MCIRDRDRVDDKILDQFYHPEELPHSVEEIKAD